jgi:hypothetical protein
VGRLRPREPLRSSAIAFSFSKVGEYPLSEPDVLPLPLAALCLRRLCSASFSSRRGEGERAACSGETTGEGEPGESSRSWPSSANEGMGRIGVSASL